MREGIAALGALVDEWLIGGFVPEVDWSRMRALDFQEILRSRDSITKRLKGRACVLCADFDGHVRR